MKPKEYLLYFLLLFAASMPIWLVPYFVNHDGSGHIYISYVMGELLRGNEVFTRHFELNSLAVPNSSGHWLMTGLLLFFSPIVVTKTIATMTLAAFTASLVWLRRRTAPDGSAAISILLSIAIGLNWLWLQGSYNFVFAAAASMFTLGLFFSWKNQAVSVGRILVIAALLSFVFIGHLVSFAVLSGSLFVVSFLKERRYRVSGLITTLAAHVPIVPLVIAYRSISQSGEPFIPTWRSLADPLSVSSWARHLINGDPFAMLSRKTLPFVDWESNGFAVFSPVIWIFAAVFILVLPSIVECLRRPRSDLSRLGFIALFAGAFLAAIVGPDDFGLTNGSILRERMLIMAMCFAVPLLPSEIGGMRRLVAVACLSFVAVFQIMALSEYSIHADSEARAFVNARSVIPDKVGISSVVVVEDGRRFHSIPSTQLINYVGINKDIVVWDNYELGHYMFPVVVREKVEKELIFEFTTSNVFYLKVPIESFDVTLSKLDGALSKAHDRLEYLFVYGRDERLDPVLGRWYETAPIYENGELRVLKHR